MEPEATTSPVETPSTNTTPAPGGTPAPAAAAPAHAPHPAASAPPLLPAHANGNGAVPSPGAGGGPLVDPSRITRVRTLRSCISCRQRKVKCDKARPCGACVKSSFQCVFPEQRRRPPRPRQPDAALVGRLARLEGVIEELSKGGGAGSAAHLLGDDGGGAGGAAMAGGLERPGRAERAESWPGSTTELDTSLGQLLISEDKSRYISPGFWASITEEVEDLKDLLAEEERDEDLGIFSPSTSFFFRSAPEDLGWLHPPLEDARYLYRHFVHAVDPVIRIIHKPTFEEQFSLFLQDRSSQPPAKGFEALVFAMYFCSVTSMHPDAVFGRYGISKSDLQSRYRTATEQALSNAGFLQSKRLTTLQALVLFCSVLREEEETRSSWSLIGLAIRIAQSLGLHRDGSLFGVSPIEVELRRRLWYEILVLDVRTAEEHGTEPSISETSYDTLKPLNIDDANLRNDVDPASLVRPNVFTETTFGLMRFPLLRIYRILLAPGSPPGSHQHERTLEEKQRLIDDTESYVLKNYCTGLKMDAPMQKCVAIISELMIAKARLFLYHPYRHYRNGELLSDDIKDQLFLNAITCVELSIKLATSGCSQQWNWFFRSFHQAHACALILLELGVRPPSELVDRAWRAIETFMEEPDLYRTGAPEMSEKYWRPLRKLRERARRNRAASLSPGGSVRQPPVWVTGGGTGGVGVGGGGVSPGGTTMAGGSGAMMPMQQGDSPIDWSEWDQMFHYTPQPQAGHHLPGVGVGGVPGVCVGVAGVGVDGGLQNGVGVTGAGLNGMSGMHGMNRMNGMAGVGPTGGTPAMAGMGRMAEMNGMPGMGVGVGGMRGGAGLAVGGMGGVAGAMTGGECAGSMHVDSTTPDDKIMKYSPMST